MKTFGTIFLLGFSTVPATDGDTACPWKFSSTVLFNAWIVEFKVFKQALTTKFTFSVRVSNLTGVMQLSSELPQVSSNLKENHHRCAIKTDFYFLLILWESEFPMSSEDQHSFHHFTLSSNRFS